MRHAILVHPILVHTVLVAFCLASASCDFFESLGDSSFEDASLAASQREFNVAATQTDQALGNAAQTVLDLRAAAEAGDYDGLAMMASTLDVRASALAAAVSRLEAAELSLQAFGDMGSSGDQKQLLIAAAGIFIASAVIFARNLQGHSDALNEARDRRDDALGALDRNEEGAVEDLQEAEQDMRDAGVAAADEIATKIVTDLVLSQVSPGSVTGLVVKDQAGNRLQDGLKVLSATGECRNGYDNPGCRLGVDELEDGEVTVPVDDDLIVIVAGDDSARVVAEGVDASAGAENEVSVDPPPIGGTSTPGTDTGPPDTSPRPDVGPTDTGSSDAAPTDAGATDAGPTDIGTSDAATSDADADPDAGGILPSSGTFPPEPLQGLSIDWNFTGGVLLQDVSQPNSDPQITGQSFFGTTTGDEIVIEGTITSNNEHVLFDAELEQYVNASMTVELTTLLVDEAGVPQSIVEEREDTDETAPGAGPWTRSFRLTVPVDPDELVTWSVAVSLYDASGEIWAIAVQATLQPRE